MKKYMFSVVDCILIFQLLICGLFISMLIYPVLHECGHVLAAYCSSAKVVDISLFPIPYVICNINGVGVWQQIIIGSFGVIFPFLVALLLPSDFFWWWYVRFLLMGITLLAICISMITLIMPDGAVWNPQDDILKVLEAWEHRKEELEILLSVGGGIVAGIIVYDRPVNRIYKKFGI